MLRTIAEPVEEQAVKNGDFQGRILKPAPASRYLDSSIITFEFLRKSLRESQRAFAYKFTALMDYFPYMAGSQENGSNRPLGEIIMEAWLKSTATEDTTPEKCRKMVWQVTLVVELRSVTSYLSGSEEQVCGLQEHLSLSRVHSGRWRRCSADSGLLGPLPR